MNEDGFDASDVARLAFAAEQGDCDAGRELIEAFCMRFRENQPIPELTRYIVDRLDQVLAAEDPTKAGLELLLQPDPPRDRPPSVELIARDADLVLTLMFLRECEKLSFELAVERTAEEHKANEATVKRAYANLRRGWNK